MPRPPLQKFKNQLEWQIDRRAKIQGLLFEMHAFLERHAEFPNDETDPDYWHAMKRMVAIAFSLWRSAFLTNGSGDRKKIYKNTKDFIYKVLTHNAITFADDHSLSELTISYYNNNARYRLERMFLHNEDLLQIPSLQRIDYLRQEGKVDLEKMKPDELWDDLYQALIDCFDRFEEDWRAKARPARRLPVKPVLV
jgi:hypothetical protein